MNQGAKKFIKLTEGQKLDEDAERIYAKFEKTRNMLYKYIDQFAKAGEDPRGAAYRMYDDLSGIQSTMRRKLKLKR